ncbi:DNA-dependent protein kinase catalytic subunit [Trichinella patagoniensis]|uniref:non-specific serine/threonine protein kinase n=1 Tax=Trichinella patagoniensis TaxID=990121 RepID=A0A0V1A7C3_9BILA|nr:DNA-dependent protein kinase catalytic subunit [Trichinella patagoniensis]
MAYSTVDQIRDALNSLKDFIEGADSDQAEDCVQQIFEHFRKLSGSERNFGFCFNSLLSNDSNSLLSILSSSIGKTAFAQTIGYGIDIIRLAIAKTTSLSPSHRKAIMRFTLRLLKQDYLKGRRENVLYLVNECIKYSSVLSTEGGELNFCYDELLHCCLALIDSLKKLQSGVKKGLFIIIGTLCQEIPEKLITADHNYALLFANIMSEELKNQMCSSIHSPSYSVIEGCFLGLNDLLAHFSNLFDGACRMSCSELFCLIKKACNPKNDVHRLGHLKAALGLVISHVQFFRHHFLDEYSLLNEYFSHWAKHSDREIKTYSLNAEDLLIRELATELITKVDSDPNHVRSVYKYFCNQFDEVFSNTSGIREISMISKSYGRLFQIGKALYGEEEVCKILRKLLQRFEYLSTTSSDAQQQKVYHITNILETASRGLICLSKIADDVWQLMERFHVTLFHNFPLMEKRFYHRCKVINFATFAAAYGHNYQYIQSIVFQSLIRVIASLPSVGKESIVLPKDENAFYLADYLPFWKMLLDSEFVDLSEFGFDRSMQVNIRRTFFDCFMKSFLEIVRLLSFETKAFQDVEEYTFRFSNPILHVIPTKQADYDLFYNLVELCRSVIMKGSHVLFEPWLQPMLTMLLELSSRYPMVSGFYKLLALWVTMAEKLNYFNSTKQDDKTENCSSHYKLLLSDFIDHVLVESCRFQGELLVSCLRFLLALPTCIVVEKLESIKESIKSSLKLGLNYLPIACVCLDALEKWSAEFPEDEPQLDSFYTDLLPIFDDYLRCTSVDETLVSNNGFNYNGEKSTLFNRKRNSGNVFDKGDDNDSEEEIPNPQTVLRRIASFVGSLGCYMNRFLINSADAGSLLRWGHGSHLEFICPFPDMKFEIALDTLLPRLCDLALSAGDRPLKVAACEALHACVLFLLGNESFRTVKVRDRESISKAYSHIFPVLLKLACDVDEVPKQMFSTLFVQILHLFSGTDFADKMVTSCLLDTLMDGLCCFWNSSLRDQSAYYISEYCRWSMRRVDNTGQNMHSESKVELLVQTIITFAVHSSAVKRAGAAVAFNNLYKIIREKRWLVDIYILEMFFTFMKSLYLAENDDELYGTVDECKQAIKHIRRIILYNLNMLRIHNERRRTPNEWSQSTIHCCCDWLLNTMTWSNYQFRSECFVSYQELTNAGLEIEKLHFLRHIGTSIFGLIDHFERSHRSVLGSFSICNLQDRVATGTSIYALVLWLETYEAMIDGYVWALNTNRISMEDWNNYLLNEHPRMKSLLFPCSMDLVNSIVIGRNFPNISKTQRNRLNKTRCKCFVALCKLIAALVNCPNLNNFQGFLKLLLYPNTWNAFLKVACDPKSLGFRLYSKQLFECISQDVRLLFLALKNNTFLVQQVSTNMKEYLTQFYPWPDVESVVTCDSHLAIEQQQLLNVYGMLVEVGLRCVVELPGAEFLWTTVADVYFSKRIGLPPSKLGMVKQIFHVAALTGSAVDVLIKLLMNTESVRLAECSTLCSTKGELLIANFSEEIALLLCTNAELFLKHLKEASRCQPDVVGRALLHTVTVVVHSSDLRKKYGRKLALQVLQIFGQELLHWADVAVSNETLKLLWLKLIMKLILIDSKITEWQEFAPMASAYFMMLNDQSLTLDFKNNMLSLLAGFCTFDKHASELGKSLKLFMVNNFPLKSDEFAKGTAKYDQYVAACQKILFAFGCTGSPLILELLLNMICREQSHPIASDLKHQLQKFSSRASRAVLENILILLDEMFFNPSSCVCASLRLALLNEFFIPFLHSLKSDLLLSWTCRRIQTLVSCLTESSISEIKTDYEEQVITRIGCYKIFEIIYKVLDLEFLKTEVNSSYLGSDSQMKNELIKKLVSCAVGAKKEFCRDSKLGSIQRHFFEYRCAAQNCIIALVKKTQSHLKHYEGFIFNDCWESIIDNEVKYEFDREIQEEEQSAGKMYYSREEKPPSAESENQVELSVLLDSSLSVMATQFDLTESLEASIHCAEKETESANDKDVLRFYSKTKLDFLDQHPCMMSMVDVINYMDQMDMIPNAANTPLPAWMASMRDFLNFGSINVRLFIARIIVQCFHVFRPFYLEWISPIIKLIVMDEFGSNILHYFRVDLIVVLFEWTAHVKKDEAIPKDSLNDLLKFCVQHCCSKSGKVFKRNLRIIETMLVLWKPFVTLDPSWILEKICFPLHDEMENLCGISILCLCLNTVPETFSFLTDPNHESGIFSHLIGLLSLNKVKVYKLAAFVCGLSLKVLNETDCEWLLKSMKTVMSRMTGTVVGRSKCLLCLHEILPNYPEFALQFFNNLLDWFPSVQGDLKTACLEGFLAVSKYKGDLFEELKSRGFLKIFSLRHERDQMLGMYIVKNIHANLSVENISDLVSSFSSVVVGNFSSSCRRAFAEMCCSLYTKLSSLNDSSENSKTALATTKMHLLTMLSDSNKSIRQLVYNFWCDASRLEISTSARLLNCLSQLYTCATESTFLSHASYVMLELTCHSPDYTRLIYEHPLEDCTFENLPISTHWQSRYASLEVPAYMQTDTHSVQQAVSQFISRKRKIPYGRTFSTESTASSGFTSTAVTDLKKNVGNVSADTFELDFDESDSSDNLTVILDKILQDIKKPKSSSVKKVDDLDGDLQFLKNRILKDTEEKAFFVNLDRKRQKVIERLKQQSLDLRGKYRSGDFPDIQIPYSAVIITLQAVAELDKVFAGQLFESLMYGVVAHVIECCSFDVTEKYFKSINDGVREIFRSMVTFHRPLVSCLMNFLYNFIEYVDFEPTDIANVAIGSGQPDCGIVLLERRIEVAFEDTTASTSHEWRPKHVNEIDQLWVELSRLYKQCGELENLRAVFTKHLLTAEETKLALEMEAAGDFEGAAAIYGETFNNKKRKSGGIVEKAEANLLYEARIRCLEMLNDWKGLEAWSTTFGSTGQTTKLDQIWETDYLINMHLPVFLRSKLKIALTSDSVALEELSTFVEQNQSVPKNREILENRHSGLLVLLNILRENFTKSQYFLSLSMDSFLKCYPTLRVCDVTARLKLVQDLLPVSETAKFLHLLHASDEFKLENVVKLCRFWLRYGLDVETTLTTTADDVVLNRKTFLEIFGKRLVDSGISVSNVQQSLLPFRLQFGYQYLKCAVRQNNHGVLLQRLQDKHLLLEASNYETWALLQLANCANAVKSRTAYLMQALNLFDLKKITDPELNTTEGSSADQFALIGMLFDNVAETVVASSENTLAEFCLSRLFSNTDTADISELVTLCYDQAFRYLKLSCQYSSVQLNIESPKLTEPLMELSSFCDRILRKNGHTSLVNSECACVMVRSILMSMKNGSHLARQLFPRLLSVMEKYPESELEFQAEIDSVPSWMFLSWLNQMLSALKRSNKFYSILERIADDYPQALIYPLLMLKSATGDAGETDFYRLQLKLRKTKIVKDFIDALTLLSHPDMHVVDELESIIMNVSNKSNEARRETMVKLYSFVTFADIRKEFLGSFWKCHFQKYLPKIQEIFCVDICTFDSKAAENYLRLCSSILNELRTFYIPECCPNNLNEYSPWLTAYRPHPLDVFLEIPGQYSGDRRPFPERHVHIIGFASDVEIMRSLKKPKKICIQGDDGRDYKYLVKAGEDLRQDERVQQLFDLMNGILQKQHQCSRLKARIRTYRIVPLSIKLGLIEFLPNVVPLQQFFMGESLRKEYQTIAMDMFTEGPGKILLKAAGEASSPLNHMTYWRSFQNISPETAARRFSEVVKKIPDHLLRDQLLNCCVSPDVFCFLRQKFTVSLAIMSIANYLLEIGDRHLGNIVLDTKTGEVIGIDFGYAFGASLQYLPIPELMPFRLTKQFVGVVEPVGMHGLLESTMKYCLKAFRDSSYILLNTMDTFIKEPSLNWIVEVRRQIGEGRPLWKDEANLRDLFKWYPEEKISAAARKLRGDNPVIIMQDELMNSRQHLSSFPLHQIINCIYGKKDFSALTEEEQSAPRGYPLQALTVEQQTSCLIEMATDPIILSRTWFGWEAWI